MHKKADAMWLLCILLKQTTETLGVVRCFFGNGIFKMICDTTTNIVLKLIAICLCHSIAFRQRDDVIGNALMNNKCKLPISRSMSMTVNTVAPCQSVQPQWIENLSSSCSNAALFHSTLSMDIFLQDSAYELFRQIYIYSRYKIVCDNVRFVRNAPMSLSIIFHIKNGEQQ